MSVNGFGLVDQRELDVIAGPALGFEGGTTGGHASPADENVGLEVDNLRIAKNFSG
jgi:hypothetical protein